MSDYANMGQLKAANRLVTNYYIADTSSHDFTSAAFSVKGLTAWKIHSISNTLMINSSAVTSADTLAAGTRIDGRIIALQLKSGRAVAYCCDYAGPEWHYVTGDIILISDVATGTVV